MHKDMLILCLIVSAFLLAQAPPATAQTQAQSPQPVYDPSTGMWVYPQPPPTNTMVISYGAPTAVYNSYTGNYTAAPAAPGYNPYTGARVATTYNPYTGAVTREDAAHNPYTGTTDAGKTTYNPYTGTATHSSAEHNPYTGNTREGSTSYNPYTGTANHSGEVHNSYTGQTRSTGGRRR